jgi:integrase
MPATPSGTGPSSCSWDSGCRINEILSRNIGNIEFDRYGAVMVVDGKTGQRRLRLTACVGDLQTWINTHPMKENPEAPLFITYNRYGFGRKRVHEHTVANRLKVLAELAKIKKPVHPPPIRHARLTDLAKQGFSEMELRIIAGWEAASGMPAIYVHMSGADVERKVLQKAGLCEDEEFKETTLEAIRCPRCRTNQCPRLDVLQDLLSDIVGYRGKTGRYDAPDRDE